MTNTLVNKEVQSILRQMSPTYVLTGQDNDVDKAGYRIACQV